MHIGFGWILFLGGIFGLMKVARAQSFREIGMGPEVNENGSTSPKRLTWRLKLMLLALNLLIALGGGMMIQRSHNWNPFKPCPSCKLDDGAVS